MIKKPKKKEVNTKTAINLLFLAPVVVCLYVCFLGYLGSTIQVLAFCFVGFIVIEEIVKAYAKRIREDVRRELVEEIYQEELKRFFVGK